MKFIFFEKSFLAKKLAPIIILIFFFLSNAYSQTHKWQQIVPVRSTLADVEKLLGKQEIRAHTGYYELPEGRYIIDFSDGTCTTKWRLEWNMPELPPYKEGAELIDWAVPEWTVLELSFSPAEDIPVTKLGLNLKKLKKVPEGGDTFLFDYLDTKTGIKYGVQFDDSLNAQVVTNIKIKPVSKDNNLRCKYEDDGRKVGVNF